MDVGILCKRTGVGGDPEILRKAKEYLRRLKNLRSALEPEASRLAKFRNIYNSGIFSDIPVSSRR